MTPGPGRVALALAVLLAVGGCATSRRATGLAGAEALAAKAGVEGVTFTEGSDGRARIVRWSGTAGYHAVATWIEALGGRLPAGCSLRLALERPQESGGRILLDASGVLAPERPAAGACVGWPSLVVALDGISAAIPAKAWTTSLVQDGDALDVSGLALTEDEARSFARALEASGAFAAVSLASAAPAEELSTSTPSLIRFRLALRLRE